MKTKDTAVLLNLGCGSNYHPDWVNLDLVPQADEVVQADLAQGIPYADESADAVYHSHVLEHLTEEDACRFIGECYRVLKPGGVMRLAVPDLEQIAREYLNTIYRSWQQPDDLNLANHRWMQLEMLDQIVRSQSGGQMGQWMSNPDLPNHSFIKSRLGLEVEQSQLPRSTNSPDSSWLKTRFRKWQRKLIRILFGKSFLKQLDEIKFRNSGEIHRWMYDRVSLRELLKSAGFSSFEVVDATRSQIEDFDKYQLDAVGSQPRKPDSIFVEAVRPSAPVAKAA